eukprot:Sspe_Gene.21234::Locus_7927_Transcript_1_1_Confidence_1.000_Length_1607::g.21234::m.21234
MRVPSSTFPSIADLDNVLYRVPSSTSPVPPGSPLRATVRKSEIILVPSPIQIEVTERPLLPGRASQWASTLNLINNVVGAGMFSMPWAMAQTSVFGGVALCILICALNTINYILLAECCELSGSFTYLSIGRRAFGSAFGYVTQGCVLLYAMGSCISFVVLSGDFLVGNGTGVFPTAPRTAVLLCIAVFIFLPLSLLRNTESLKWTSLLSFIACICAATMVVYVVWYCPPVAFKGEDANAHLDTTVNWASVGSAAWLAVPIINVAFTAHYNAPRFYQELADRSVPAFLRVVSAAMAFSFVVYVATGVAGYLTFGNRTLGSILLNFSPSWQLASIARLLLALVVIFTFPLANHAVRESLLALLSCGRLSTNTAPSSAFWAVTVFTVALSTSIGIMVEQVEEVLAYKGAIFGNCLVYIFPPLMYLRLKGADMVPSMERRWDSGIILLPAWGVCSGLLSVAVLLRR